MSVLEHAKTFVLWAMILTSVVLTWFVWTYQPAYEELGETDSAYIEIEDIGESKSFSELLYPNEVISHEEESQYWVHPAGENYLELLDALGEIELEEMRLAGASHIPDLDRSFEGIEMIFDHPLDGTWLQYVFDIEEEEILINNIDRIVIAESNETNDSEVSARFIDMEEEEIYESDTGLSVTQLHSFTQGISIERTEVEARVFQEEDDTDFQPVKYVAAEPVLERVFTYETTNISPDGFIQTLFADPDYVRQYFQEGQSSSYTDGTRMMDMLEGGSILQYIQPDLTSAGQQPSASVVRSAQEFVNGHYGWTDDFYATSWNESGMDDSAEFTMHVEGLPVFDADSGNEHHYTIELLRSGSEIIEYMRPMFQLDTTPFQVDTNVELPAFEDVEEYIEEEDLFPAGVIEDARVAYFMSRQNSFAVFEPSWFVYARGQWHRITVPNSSGGEVLEGGLE